jgi:hypothetical protein
MVKPAEVKQVLSHAASTLMIFTAVMVIATDFLIGVLSGPLSMARCSGSTGRVPRVALLLWTPRRTRRLTGRNGDGSMEPVFISHAGRRPRTMTPALRNCLCIVTAISWSA